MDVDDSSQEKSDHNDQGARIIPAEPVLSAFVLPMPNTQSLSFSMTPPSAALNQAAGSDALENGGSDDYSPTEGSRDGTPHQDSSHERSTVPPFTISTYSQSVRISLLEMEKLLLDYSPWLVRKDLRFELYSEHQPHKYDGLVRTSSLLSRQLSKNKIFRVRVLLGPHPPCSLV